MTLRPRCRCRDVGNGKAVKNGKEPFKGKCRLPFRSQKSSKEGSILIHSHIPVVPGNYQASLHDAVSTAFFLKPSAQEKLQFGLVFKGSFAVLRRPQSFSQGVFVESGQIEWNGQAPASCIKMKRNSAPHSMRTGTPGTGRFAPCRHC